jgi:hypothetical protein
MSQAEYGAAFKGSPMTRTNRRGLARNAAVALGSMGTADDLPVLEAARCRFAMRTADPWLAAMPNRITAVAVRSLREAPDVTRQTDGWCVQTATRHLTRRASCRGVCSHPGIAPHIERT